MQGVVTMSGKPSARAIEFARADLRLTHAVALLWCEATAVPFDPARPHPSLAYQVAMDAVHYPTLFAHLGVTRRDRAVAGEIAIDIAAAVQIDQDYGVRVSLDPVEHKYGGTIGAFERATIRSAAFRPGAEAPDFAVTASILVTRGSKDQ